MRFCFVVLSSVQGDGVVVRIPVNVCRGCRRASRLFFLIASVLRAASNYLCEAAALAELRYSLIEAIKRRLAALAARAKRRDNAHPRILPTTQPYGQQGGLKNGGRSQGGRAGADGAEQKKQYLLDRIATSDGFKDAKAHKEEEDDSPVSAGRRRPQRKRRPARTRRRRSADDPSSWTTWNP